MGKGLPPYLKLLGCYCPVVTNVLQVGAPAKLVHPWKGCLEKGGVYLIPHQLSPHTS